MSEPNQDRRERAEGLLAELGFRSIFPSTDKARVLTVLKALADEAELVLDKAWKLVADQKAAVRAEAFEEAAQVADNQRRWTVAAEIARAIRALSEKEPKP